jgi:hypothetical protein
MSMNFMDLDVAEERTVFYGDEFGNPKLDPDEKLVFNVTQNKKGCYASKGYNIIQHRETVQSLFEGLAGLNIKFVSKIKQQGHRIFVDAEFPDVPTIKLTQKGEEFAIGVRLINSYDKTTGLVVVPMVKRLVCSNGMVLKTFGEGIVMKHNASIAKAIAGKIEQCISKIINSHQNLQKMVNECIGDSIEWQMVEKIMQRLIGRKKHMDEIKSRMNPANGMITRWDLYCAITNWATHGEALKPNVESWLQSKAEKLLRTPLVTLAAIEEVE